MLILLMLLVFPILSSNSFYLFDIVYSPERGGKNPQGSNTARFPNKNRAVQFVKN